MLIDETAFSKKGTKTVGVARQYNGRLGKIDNCQVAVFAALACVDRAPLVGTRLYLPEEWCNDASRCPKAGIPEEERVFKTKTQLALELVKEQRAGGLRFDWVGVDTGYGKEPAFLRALDDMGKNSLPTFIALRRFGRRIRRRQFRCLVIVGGPPNGCNRRLSQ